MDINLLLTFFKVESYTSQPIWNKEVPMLSVFTARVSRSSSYATDYKTLYNNALRLERFICRFVINPNSAKNQKIVKELLENIYVN